MRQTSVNYPYCSSGTPRALRRPARLSFQHAPIFHPGFRQGAQKLGSHNCVASRHGGCDNYRIHRPAFDESMKRIMPGEEWQRAIAKIGRKSGSPFAPSPTGNFQNNLAHLVAKSALLSPPVLWSQLLYEFRVVVIRSALMSKAVIGKFRFLPSSALTRSPGLFQSSNDFARFSWHQMSEPAHGQPRRRRSERQQQGCGDDAEARKNERPSPCFCYWKSLGVNPKESPIQTKS